MRRSLMAAVSIAEPFAQIPAGWCQGRPAAFLTAAVGGSLRRRAGVDGLGRSDNAAASPCRPSSLGSPASDPDEVARQRPVERRDLYIGVARPAAEVG